MTKQSGDVNGDPPPAKGFNGISTAIAAAAALMTAVGVSSGVATRMLRNEWPLVILFLLVMVLAVLVTIVARDNRDWALGFFFFFVGVVGLTALAGTTSQAKERPQILTSSEITSSGLVKVSTTVKADGLKTDELIYIASRGSQRVAVNPVTGYLLESSSGRTTSVIEEAAFGPGADGSVNATYTLEVSPALYAHITIRASRGPDVVANEEAECIPRARPKNSIPALGCARLILPLAPIRPFVSASVTAGSSESAPRALTATVSAGGVPPSKTITLRAWESSDRPLLDEALASDVGGNVKATIAVPLAGSTSEVCVVVALVPSTAHASPKDVTRALCDRTSDLPETVGIAVVRRS